MSLIQHLVVQCVALPLVVAIYLKSHKSETAGPTGLLISHYRDVNHLAECFHVALNVLLSRRVKDATNEVLHKVGLVWWSVSLLVLHLRNRSQVSLQL